MLGPGPAVRPKSGYREQPPGCPRPQARQHRAGAMPRRACVECGAAFPCAPSFRGRGPKCGICPPLPATQGGRQHAPWPAEAKDAPQTAQRGAAGSAAPQPGHMAPCACHCAACRAAGHNGTACVFLCAGLHDLFDGKADIVGVVLRHYHGACGWATARCDTTIYCVQYGPAGDVIAAGGSNGRIHLICAQTGENILCPLRGHDSAVMSVSWSPDGSRLASGSRDKTVRLWDASTGAPIGSPLRGHDKAVSSLAFKPDAPNVLVTGSWDKTVKLWDLSTSTCLSTMSGHSDCVRSVSWSPDGAKLASGSDDKTVRIWEVATGKELSQLRAHSNHVNAVAWSPCGRWLASGGGDRMVYVYDAKTFEVKSSLSGHSDWVFSVAWSPDGTKLAGGSKDKTVCIWEAATGKQLSQLGGEKPIRCLAFSRNGRTLASGDGWVPDGRDYSIRLYHVEAGTQIR